MNSFDRFLTRYIYLAVPLIALMFVGDHYFGASALSQSSGAIRFINDVLGWNLMLWILTMLYVTSKMTFSRVFREIILSRITGMKERDEREVEISGNAAKFSMLSTLAFLLFFLFLSMFSIKVARTPGLNVGEDPHGYVTIDSHFNVFSFESPKTKSNDNDGKVVIEYRELPITKSALLLFLILWQVGSYQVMVRREIRTD